MHGGVDEIPLVTLTEGRLFLAGKRFVAPDPDGALASVRASLLVCLCEEHEFAERWPGFVEWLRLRAGAGALWLPVPDLHAPSPAQAHHLVSEVTARLDAGDAVLVHCGAGMGRAGTLATAVLLHLGLPLADALRVVADARPGAGPEVGAQTELLEALAGATRR